jgi:uncharacterized protein with FMN-binding domain
VVGGAAADPPARVASAPAVAAPAAPVSSAPASAQDAGAASASSKVQPAVVAAGDASESAAAANAPEPASASNANAPEPAATANANAPGPAAASNANAPGPAAAEGANPDSAKGAARVYKDGVYTGWGSSLHGRIEATVQVTDGRIVDAKISTCRMRWPCARIAFLVPQPVERQGTEIDVISRVTESSDAFYYALVEALSKAK